MVSYTPSMSHALNFSLTAASVRFGWLMFTRQKKTFHTIFLLTVAVLLCNVLLAGALGGRALRSVLSADATVHIDIIPTANDSDIQSLYAALVDQPWVRVVALQTSAQALSDARRKHPELVAMLDAYHFADPFPTSIVVTPRGESVSSSIATFLGEPRWQSIVAPYALGNMQTGYERALRLLRIADGLSAAFSFFAVAGWLLVVVLLFHVLVQAVSTHKDELSLLHRMGANRRQLIVPFLSDVTVMLTLGVLWGALLFAMMVLWAVMTKPADPFLQTLTSSFLSLLRSWGALILLLELLCVPLLVGGATLLSAGHLLFVRRFSLHDGAHAVI